MFGRILSIHEYTVIIENMLKRVETSVLGMHVIFDGKYKVVGEITRITDEIIETVLVGEFINNKFYSGMTHKPSGTSNIMVYSYIETILPNI